MPAAPHPPCSARPFRALLLVLVLSGAAALPVPAEAATREQAIEQALRADGNRGRVLEVRRTTTGDGRAVFLIKTITDGRVRVHRIAADG